MNQAIKRKTPATPIKWLIKNNFVSGNILHFGRGKDIPGTLALAKIGKVTEYDPNIPKINNRKMLKKQYNTIVSCFVLNCLRPVDRFHAIRDMSKALALTGSAFIAVRSIKDTDIKIKQQKWSVYKDGFTNYNIIKNKLKTATSYGTFFQKFYAPNALTQELEKYFKTAFILYDKNGFIIAQATNIKLPKRSVKYGLGKQMINCVYLHKSSEHILPGINKIKRHIPKTYDYTIVKFNWVNNTFSFIQSPDFNSANEPAVGNSLIVYANGKNKLIKAPHDPWIYHHKWLMVKDSYKGFNVSISKSHSIKWIKLKPNRSKIGKKSYWIKNILPLLSMPKS